MLRCRIRVGGYDKRMKLKVRSCAEPATHLAAGYPICGKHAEKIGSDNVVYNVQPDGARLPQGAQLQKLAA